MDTRSANNLGGLALRRGGRVLSRTGQILLLLAAVLLLGAWSDFTGNTINPRYVQAHPGRQDHQAGGPACFLEIPRRSSAPIWGRSTSISAIRTTRPDMPYKPEERKIEEQSDQIYLLDDKKQIKKPVVKKEGKIPRSTLTIRFKKDGDTVMSHEYKEF